MNNLSHLSVSATTISQNYIIYKTINLINGMYYIGKHSQETSGYDGYLGSGVRLNYAIKKYGIENFVRETIEYCTLETINEREIYWIDALSATNRKVGYNITIGGKGGWNGIRHSDETKQKISKANTGRSKTDYFIKRIKEVNTGSIKSEETKRKISESHKGKKFSDEHRRNLSEAKKGKSIGKGKIILEDQRKQISETLKKFFSDPLERQKLRERSLGKKHTEESIQKMRDIHKGHEVTEETRKKISESHKRRKQQNY